MRQLEPVTVDLFPSLRCDHAGDERLSCFLGLQLLPPNSSRIRLFLRIESLRCFPPRQGCEREKQPDMVCSPIFSCVIPLPVLNIALQRFAEVAELSTLIPLSWFSSQLRPIPMGYRTCTSICHFSVLNTIFSQRPNACTSLRMETVFPSS